MTDPRARHGSATGPLPASTSTSTSPSSLPSPAIICLMGPTASGKSGIALELAQTLPIEIISVDSALIYRGMDIGTAKPSAAERARVPHHLIDILDPAQSYSAAQFRSDALRLIDEIRARGRLPLLVGGTMLYFKALREGLDDLPVADAVLRAQIEREAERSGWPALHAELAQVDAATAARLAPNDAQRIQRALEVWRLTGKPISAFHQRAQRAAEGSNASRLSDTLAAPATSHATPLAGAQAMPRFVNIALEPSDRAALHARIEARFDAMLEQGFLDEVRMLRARGDLHPGLPSMRCVGYRQAWEYLDGRINGLQMRAQSIAATRQLAKRQLTWLRALDDRIVIDCLADDCPARVRSAIGPHSETL